MQVIDKIDLIQMKSDDISDYQIKDAYLGALVGRTANRIGKYGIDYPRRFSLCIETQNLLDTIHLEESPTTILKKGEVYDKTTSYTFEVVK